MPFDLNSGVSLVGQRLTETAAASFSHLKTLSSLSLRCFAALGSGDA